VNASAPSSAKEQGKGRERAPARKAEKGWALLEERVGDLGGKLPAPYSYELK